MQERKCPCCGAPVPNYKNICDYCGMVFKDDHPPDIQFVGIRPNMRRVSARARVPEYLIDGAASTEAMARVAKRDIIGQLAEGLTDMVTWRMDRDPRTCEIIVAGELWVQEPDVRLVNTDVSGW